MLYYKKNTPIIKKSLFLTIFLTIMLTYLYGPFYLKGFVRFGQLFYYGLSFLPLLSFFLIRGKIKFKSDFYCFFILLLLYFSQVLFIPFVTSSFDLNYILTTFRFGVTWICGTLSVFCAYIFLSDKNYIRANFLRIVLNAFSLYVLGTVLFVAIPALREFWITVIYSNNKYQQQLLKEVSYITRFGFGGYTGFGFAFYISSCAVILSFLFINKLISEKKTILYLFIICLGGSFYGRTGLVVSLSTFFCLSLHCIYTRRKKIIFYIFAVVLLLITIGFVLYFAVPSLHLFFEWCLSPIFSYVNTGRFGTGSTDILMDFYRNFHPSDKTFFIGDGHWGNLDGSYYGKTDVGFMRNIYYGGIFYMLAQYSLVILLITLIYLKMKHLNYRGILFIPLMLFMHFVIFEMKGDIAFLFMQQYIPFLLVITHPEYLPAEPKHTTRKISLIKKYALHFNTQI